MYASRLKRSKLGTQVLDIMRDMIANQRFQAGARINVEELSRELGVSRTPLWEAIHRLEHEGLLVRVPHRGVFITELTGEQALQLYAVRQLLEAAAAREAAVRITQAGLDRMQELLAEQEALSERRDLVGYSRSDFAFHAVVYEACGNPYLREMLERIKSKMLPFGPRIEEALPELVLDHRHLLEALRAHDPDRAENAFRAHNERVIRIITRATEEASTRSAG